jgi:hypothetical protein
MARDATRQRLALHAGRADQNLKTPKIMDGRPTYRGGTHLPGVQINETDGLTRLRGLSPCRRTQGRMTRQIRNSKRPLIMTRWPGFCMFAQFDRALAVLFQPVATTSDLDVIDNVIHP